MSSDIIQVRMDRELKEQATAVFEEIGVDIPTAVRMFFKAVVREKKIPFATITDREMERRKSLLVGTGLILPDAKVAKAIQHKLSEEGYTVYLNNPGRKECRLWIADYLPPVTRDSDGFFIENDALAIRIRRELGQDPYNRTDGSISLLLLTNDQRNGNEDVLGFAPGRIKKPGYQPEYMYITSSLFLYTNLEACISMVCQNFDIYGFDYSITWQQWETVMRIAAEHGKYSISLAQEIDRWLREVSSDDDPAMSIMCI